MTFCIRKSPSRGLTALYGFPQKPVTTLSMGLVHLDPGDRFGETLNRRECVLLLLRGAIAIKGNAIEPVSLSAPVDLLAESPTLIHCPPGIFSMKSEQGAELLLIRGDLVKNTEGGAPAITHGRVLAAGGTRLYMPNQPTSFLHAGCYALGTGTKRLDLGSLSGDNGSGMDSVWFFDGKEGAFSAHVVISDAGRPVEEFEITGGTAVVVPAGMRAECTVTQGRALACWGARNGTLAAAK